MNNPMPVKISSEDLTNIYIRIIRGKSDECWPWISKTREGYGYWCIKIDGKLVKYKVNRLVWFIETGKDPSELLVLHECDNKICCNFKHLFLGDYTTNNRDMAQKGRLVNWEGKNSHYAVLTEEEVLEIRALYATNKYTILKLADIFCVSHPTISRIINRQTWNNI